MKPAPSFVSKEALSKRSREAKPFRGSRGEALREEAFPFPSASARN